MNDDEVKMCANCGELYPEVCMVSDEDWVHICGATFPLDCILCEACMKSRLQRFESQHKKEEE